MLQLITGLYRPRIRKGCTTLDVIKIIFILIIIITLLRRHVHMGAAMTIGALLMAFLFHLSAAETLGVLIETVIQPSTLQTALALMLIMILENMMRRNNLLEKLVMSLKLLLKDYRAVMPVPPAFLGLLPSAGGALFSAPMVSSACIDHELTAERKGVINFWYRHVWECVLPLYPAMIIATEIMGVGMTQFIRNTYPFTLMAIILGIPYLFFRLQNDRCENTKTTGSPREKMHELLTIWQDLVKGILPIVTVLLLFFVVHLPLSASLGIVILGLAVMMRLSLLKWPSILKESVSIKILLILFGIMIFKNMLESSGAVTALVDLFSNQGISITILAMVIPFFVAFLTGMSQAYVAIAFPILLGMMPVVDLPLMALAYVSGFAGLMLSPMHLCLVLTSEFFQARMGKMILMMVPPLCVMVGVGWLLTQI